MCKNELEQSQFFFVFSSINFIYMKIQLVYSSSTYKLLIGKYNQFTLPQHINYIYQQLLMTERRKKMIEKNECEKGYKEGQKLHHPSKNSGVTIGPGIDLKSYKTPEDIQKKYKGVVTQEELKIMKKGWKLIGKQADQFCKEHENFKLSQSSYFRLLDHEEKFCRADVQRIMNKKCMYDSYKEYNKNTFQKCPQYIKDIFIDMRYNGRFTPGTRRLIIPKLINYQKAMKAGDTEKARDILKVVNQTIVKIYTNPNVDNLKDDPRRGDKIKNYIQKNQNDDCSISFKPSQTASTNSNFYEQSKRTLDDIDKNKNQVGGVDLGFDISKYRFSGFHYGPRGFSLKNDCEGNGVKIEDIVVPLKIMSDATIQSKGILVSLDPYVPTQPDGPLFKKVYFPAILEGTPIGNAMIQADYLMKQLNLGVDQDNKPFKYPKSLIDVGLDFGSLAKKFPKVDNKLDRARLWIVIEDVQITEKQNGCVEIGKVKMGIKGKMQQIGNNGELKDGQGQLTKHNEQFVRLFSKYYDLIEQQYPIFKKVKQYAKAATLARLFLERGCNINQQLIDNMYKQQYKEVGKTQKRLQHKIESTIDNKTTIRRLSGGCDFSIKKAHLLNPQPVLTQITNEINLKQNYSPFIFQQISKCEIPGCGKLCNLDYFSNKEKKCFNHTKMKCFDCYDLILFGQKYTKADDYLYHSDCMACYGCENSISQEELKNIGAENGKFYHKECYPVGYCHFCRDVVKNGQDPVSYEGQTIHKKCFQQWKKAYTQKIQQTAPKCKQCNKPITGTYKYNGIDNWHVQCFKQPICEICNKPNNIVSLEDRKIHLSCIKCEICKKSLQMSQQFGNMGENKYVHINCANKK